ncbi:MAG: efflux RND transporter permease subunit, partial [Clostridiales Family XIII bacterium]|nr:efflux RND transporter permease subunit [Clostridiales Family XIII bacterium]
FGIISFTRLPVDLFPKMELPMTVVVTNYSNAAPTEVESMVTRPIEQQVATTENISGITSYSSEGMSLVLAEFENGTDMNFAGLNIREKIDLVADYLPESASKPMVISMNPDMLPIASLYISGDLDMSELTRIAQDEIIPAFERMEGVASTSMFGGTEEEIRVSVDQARLEGYHLTLAQISQALSASNISLPSGVVKKGNLDVVVRTIGEFHSLDELKNVALPLPTQEVVRLGDIAEIVKRERVQQTIGRVDGNPAIGVSINKQTVANTVQVDRRLDQVIAELKEKYPYIEITPGINQADFINESIAFVTESAILGCLLAVLICLLFLRSFASTMIIAISIPTSIIATFILMFATGFTMNMLSLSGLAVGIGMLVDDSIVVMENIFRRRGEGLDVTGSSVEGTREVTMPVVAATATKIAVFLPIVFVEGIASTIFKEFSFTIGFALICSLIVALTVIPMLCSRLLGRGSMHIDTDYLERPEDGLLPVGGLDGERSFNPLILFGRLLNHVIQWYTGVIRFALRHRKMILSLCVVLLVVSAALVGYVGGELLPGSDESSLSVTARMPYGTSIEDIDKVMKEIESYVATEVEGLESYSLSIGGTDMMSYGTTSSANTGTIDISLVDKRQRALSTEETVAQITEGLSDITGARVRVQATNQMSLSMGGSPIQIELSGDDYVELDRIANDVLAIVKETDGTINAASSLQEGNPEVQVVPSRAIASAYGVSAYQIAQALSQSLDGVRSTSLQEGDEQTQIILSLNGEYGSSIENLEQISMMTQTGQTVTVGEVADIALANSPARIQRQDQVRTIHVTADLSGRDLQSVSTDIERSLSTYAMPQGYQYSMGGEAEEMISSFSDLVYALLLSLLIVFMILASQFESLIQPFIVMLAIPFALTGAFIGMFLTNTPLSLVAFLGIIMLSGIVVNNSILLVDFINKNRAHYDTRTDAIVAAGRFRFRPILMTMLTTCLGLLPLALGLGSGGELIQPMGISVIGGLLFSTVVTLVLIPVIYAIIDEKREKGRLRREARRAERQERLRLRQAAEQETIPFPQQPPPAVQPAQQPAGQPAPQQPPAGAARPPLPPQQAQQPQPSQAGHPAPPPPVGAPAPGRPPVGRPAPQQQPPAGAARPPLPPRQQPPAGNSRPPQPPGGSDGRKG